MPYRGFRDRRRRRRAAADLYGALVAQARAPAFYRDCAVPDTVDGRFDMIALHLALLLRRLKGEGPAADGLGQALVDALFDDMDRNLREMGVGDLGVGKRVKVMAKAFYGRLAAYDDTVGRHDGRFEGALHRNLYRGATLPEGAVETVAAYARDAAAALSRVPLDDILRGVAAWPDTPDSAERGGARDRAGGV